MGLSRVTGAASVLRSVCAAGRGAPRSAGRFLNVSENYRLCCELELCASARVGSRRQSEPLVSPRRARAA